MFPIPMDSKRSDNVIFKSISCLESHHRERVTSMKQSL
jgi:hypothetical protein